MRCWRPAFGYWLVVAARSFVTVDNGAAMNK